MSRLLSPTRCGEKEESLRHQPLSNAVGEGVGGEVDLGKIRPVQPNAGFG
jgi:hypothetical protein